MKNALATIALVISIGGIFVSIAREEMRCYMGLSDDCGLHETTSPEPTHKAVSKSEEREARESPRKTEPISNRHAEPSYQSEEPKKKSETKQPSVTEAPPEKSVVTESVEKALAQPTKSQPIEVIPPPEAANETKGQPIEVIPPPEEH